MEHCGAKIDSNISFNSTRSGEIIVKTIFENIYVRTYDGVLNTRWEQHAKSDVSKTSSDQRRT